jgi:hypothetical protein
LKAEIDGIVANVVKTPQYEELVAKFGKDLEKYASIDYESNEKYTKLIEKADKTLIKREVLKLLLKVRFSHAPVSVYVKPGTKELSIWNSDTKQLNVHTIQ